ncbi:MAG TPA: LacI family DNA-binding transcriptional regulator [Terriglobales bacterium]|nr:LacI family DNA-binding transcriptional regulator [Terriglobales bacterium]
MAVRMKDIAADLGVSAVTISKVLRNQGRISAGTRERVLRRIKELNYQPNFAARSLVSGRTFLIGLVVPDLTHPFFAAIAKSLSGTLRTRGYAVAVSSSEEDCELEAQEISAFLARRVDALIVASSQRSKNTSIFKRLRKEKVPFVLADRIVPDLNAHFVGSDDKAIGRIATEHLIDRGRRLIAHIRRPDISPGINRFKGYEEAMKKHRIKIRPEFVGVAESGDDRGEQCGFEAMQKLLSLRPHPDAVFCYNDIIGFGALKAIQEAGLRVPQDVAVVGASNLSALTFWRTTQLDLTTVDQDVPAIADVISKLVLDVVENGPRSRYEHVLIPPKLVIREST